MSTTMQELRAREFARLDELGTSTSITPAAGYTARRRYRPTPTC